MLLKMSKTKFLSEGESWKLTGGSTFQSQSKNTYTCNPAVVAHTREQLLKTLSGMLVLQTVFGPSTITIFNLLRGSVHYGSDMNSSCMNKRSLNILLSTCISLFTSTIKQRRFNRIPHIS
jgi:hypothetical protein